MSYDQNWGFGEQSFTSKYKECAGDDKIDRLATSSFLCTAELSAQMIHLLKPQSRTMYKFYKLEGDHDESCFHAVSHMLQDDKSLAFPVIEKLLMVLVYGHFDIMKIKLLLNLDFVEISYEDAEVQFCDSGIKYVILSSLIWTCLKNGWKAVSTDEDGPRYGTFARLNVETEIHDVCFINNVTLNHTGEVIITFRTAAYRAQHYTEEEEENERTGDYLCMYSGEKFTRIIPVASGREYEANIYAKRKGYNTFLPESFQQTFQYFRLRYGVIHPPEVKIVVAKAQTCGEYSIPKNSLVRSFVELPAKSKKRSATIAELVVKSFKEIPILTIISHSVLSTTTHDYQRELSIPSRFAKASSLARKRTYMQDKELDAETPLNLKEVKDCGATTSYCSTITNDNLEIRTTSRTSTTTAVTTNKSNRMFKLAKTSSSSSTKLQARI